MANTPEQIRAVVDQLHEQLDQATDPAKRASIRDDIHYLTGEPDLPGLLDDE